MQRHRESAKRPTRKKTPKLPFFSRLPFMPILRFLLSLMLLGFLLWESAASLSAQETELPGTPIPRLLTFQPADYGGEGQNWDVATDARGVLYLANAAGVFRYDGTAWQSSALPGRPTVRTIAVANDRLYAGGYGAFGYFPTKGGHLGDWVPLSGQLSQGEQNEEIWNIEVLTDGTVVFQSFGRLFVYDGKAVTTVLPPGVMMFAAAAGAVLIVPVTGQGVYRWRPGGDFVPLAGVQRLGQREIVSIVPAASGLLLAVDDGIYHWAADTLRVWSPIINEQLKNSGINRLLELPDGSLAIGTITGGVYFADAERGVRYQLDEESGLGNNTVLSLTVRPNGNVWVGLDRGLALITRSDSLSYLTGAFHPPGAAYTAARFDGKTYLGTNQGVFVMETSGGKPTYRFVPGTSGQVWELRATPNGLLCGHNDGTFLLDGGAVHQVSDRSGGWETLPCPDDSGALLQATYTGLQLLEPDQEGYRVTAVGDIRAPIRVIHWLNGRELLALHASRGAFRIRLSEDFHRLISLDTLGGPPLVKASAISFGDTLLIQSKDGVFHFKEGVPQRLTTFRGVPLEAGDYCLAGRNSDAWFLARPDRVVAYRGGVRISELPLRLRFPYPAILPWGENEYLFLLEEGLAVGPVGVNNEAAPELLLSAFNTGPGGAYRSRPEGTLTDDLDYEDNDLRFTFALPGFDRVVMYRSKLEGYTDGWSAWAARGERAFTSLPAGTYRFSVEANWYGAKAEMTFTILPPWYRSPLAYVAYAVILIGFLWLLYRLHLQRLCNQARGLEVIRQRQLQRERIVTRNRELSADVRRKSEELANTTLSLAKKNEILLTLREEIDKSRRQPDRPVDHRKVQHLIDRNLNNEEDWAIFESHFNEVHEAFLKRLRKAHPDLTTGDLKLAAYLRMDLSSKEIAPLLHISVRGVENKRYRLRKKMELESGDDLNRYLLEF